MNQDNNDRRDILKSERRIKRVAIDIDIVGQTIIPNDQYDDFRLKIDGLPKDALFVSAALDMMSYSVNFFYLHESFEPTREGTVVPLLDVLVTRIEKDATNA